MTNGKVPDHTPHIAVDKEVGRGQRTVVESSSLDLALHVGKLENLVASHALELHGLSRLAPERRHLDLVMLELMACISRQN
jgi:hypothetical protein